MRAKYWPRARSRAIRPLLVGVQIAVVGVVAGIAVVGSIAAAIGAGLAAAGRNILGGDAALTFTYRAANEDERAWMDDAGTVSEVVDLRSVAPIDTATLNASVAKTGRLVAADTGHAECGVSAEVIAAGSWGAQVVDELDPGDAPLGDTWADPGFDDSGWSVGTTGLGFANGSYSQFDVTFYKANIGIGTLATAEAVIADPQGGRGAPNLAFEGTGEARLLERAEPAHRLRPGDVDDVVGEEQADKSAVAVGAPRPQQAR